MERKMWHIVIGEHPACLRGKDGIDLMNAARAQGAELCCSSDNKDKLEKTAALYREYHPEWGDIAVAEGYCPVASSPDAAMIYD